jgi:hypothetical protein
VILLHGFCLDPSSWDIQIGQLIRQWGNDIRIISYDHPTWLNLVFKAAADFGEGLVQVAG